MTAAHCTVAIARAACLRVGAAALPRVWCRELSVLDAEVGDERWVWHVPARPGNDVELDTPQREIAGIHVRPTVARTAKARKSNAPHGAARLKPRKNTLTAWLRSQDGGQP